MALEFRSSEEDREYEEWRTRQLFLNTWECYCAARDRGVQWLREYREKKRAEGDRDYFLSREKRSSPASIKAFKELSARDFKRRKG